MLLVTGSNITENCKDTIALMGEGALADLFIKILNWRPKAATVVALLHHQDEGSTTLQHTVNCLQPTQFNIQKTWIFSKIPLRPSNPTKLTIFPLYSRHILSLGDIFFISKLSAKFVVVFYIYHRLVTSEYNHQQLTSSIQSVTAFVAFSHICLMHCSVYFVPLVFLRTCTVTDIQGINIVLKHPVPWHFQQMWAIHSWQK